MLILVDLSSPAGARSPISVSSGTSPIGISDPDPTSAPTQMMNMKQDQELLTGLLRPEWKNKVLLKSYWGAPPCEACGLDLQLEWSVLKEREDEERRRVAEGKAEHSRRMAEGWAEQSRMMAEQSRVLERLRRQVDQLMQGTVFDTDDSSDEE